MEKRNATQPSDMEIFLCIINRLVLFRLPNLCLVAVIILVHLTNLHEKQSNKTKLLFDRNF